MAHKIIRRSIIGVLRLVRPSLGPARCKYPVSCMEFAILQLNELPLRKAIPSIVRQVLSCNPFW